MFIQTQIDNIEAVKETNKNIKTDTLENKIGELQKIGKIPEGTLEFQKLKAVGTDCIKGDPDALIQID